MHDAQETFSMYYIGSLEMGRKQEHSTRLP
jgi:hypothetical protein